VTGAAQPRLPEAVLRKDPTILTYYDLAQMQEEGREFTLTLRRNKRSGATEDVDSGECEG